MTAGTATSWFARPMRAPVLAPDAVPVLCLPYAGGGASAFRGWAEAFAPQIDIRPVQLPGRESRWAEEAVIDPAALAGAISETVSGDYLIYGHSMGARLGYETIRTLAATGGPLPRRLVVGGSPPPDLRLDGDLKDLSRRSDDEMITRLARLGGMPQEVLDSPELIELLLPAIRADFTWIDDYRFTPGPALPVPVTAVCGRRDGVCLPWTGIGWSRHSAPGFRLRTVPGGHFFLHEQFGLLGGLLRAEATGTVAPALVVRPGEVQLVLADLDAIDDHEQAGLAEQLAPQEHQRAARFVDPQDARRFVARRGVVRDVLSRFGSGYRGTALPTAPDGKPELPDGPQLSWSHRDGTLLLGVAADPLGVDHETEHPLPDTALLAASILHPDELSRLTLVPEELHGHEVLRAWTAKEAVLKCTGQGLTVEPTSLGLQQLDEHAGIIAADDHRQPAVLRVTDVPAALHLPAPEVVVVQLRAGPAAVATAQMFPDWSVDEMDPVSRSRPSRRSLMTSPHTVALGSTGWEIWRDVIIRSAGFPVEGLQRLQDAAAAAALDAALADGQSVQHLAALAHEALQRQLPTIEQIATDPLLREAIAWQNPNVFHALGRVVPDGPRNSRYHQGVRTVGRYWQRYCSKNESIGFFGPATWARIEDDGPTVQARPGTGLLARRWTKLEDWALDALATTIAADPAVAPHLPVRIPSSVILGPPTSGGPATARAATGKPQQLTVAEEWALRAADGRARSALVSGAVEAGIARTTGDAELTLRRLTDRGLVSIGFDVRHVHDVADRLRADLQALPEPARTVALGRFESLDAARADLAAAAGDPAAVLAADTALKEAFQQQVSPVTDRRPGETYAGRKLAYEDTARDLDVRFGPALLERIAAPLGLLLQAAHWWCAHLEATFGAAFGDLVDEMGDGRPMPLSDLLFLAQGLLWGEHNLVASQTDEFAGRWAELLGTAGADPRDGLAGSIELTSAELAPEMDRLFPRLPLRWRAAHIHSPDLQIAANGLDALLAGEFTVVLGELHTGGGTFDSAATTLAHEHPEVLADALTADIGSHRVHVLHADWWPRQLGRLSTVFDGPHDRYLPVAPEPVRGIAEPHFLPPGDALVVRDDQGIGVLHDGLRWSLIDVLADLLWIHTVDAFKMVTPARYTPRISIDGLVINRRSWRITCGETAFGTITDAPNRFVEARRLAADLHLPDRCYVKLGSEIKPFYVDLTSPVLSDVFGCMVRSAVLAEGPQVTLSFSEALPDLEENWLPDADGRRYVCELRMQCVERDEFSTGPQAVPTTDRRGDAPGTRPVPTPDTGAPTTSGRISAAVGAAGAEAVVGR